MKDKAKNAAEALPPGTELIALQTRSVPESLAGWLPAPQNSLVAVASSWPGFLKMGHTMLLASGFHPGTLVFRDARKKNWQRGLGEMAAVVCDCVTAAGFTATRMSNPHRVVVFSLLSEAFRPRASGRHKTSCLMNREWRKGSDKRRSLESCQPLARGLECTRPGLDHEPL